MSSRIWVMIMTIVISLITMSCQKDDGFNEEEITDTLSVYVYRAGVEMHQDRYSALYMKNRQKVVLPSVTGGSTIARDIKVSGDDVYVVGEELNEEQESVKALLWVNGQAQELNAPNSKSVTAKAVFVKDNDVYVIGSYLPQAENATYRAIVWKNGEFTHIGSNDVSTRLEDIFVFTTNRLTFQN
ncbi:hypothetical protein SAMN02927937_01746 [Paenimyroides aquimaris]|uniref:Uncharacterized protein n=1 Tax=Paenimyroides marinum TaxID=1159016 RepID=A0A1H6L8P9_9FLAO|nr:hypothetical protein [Paenimyroides aquimaris]SEH84852.1 hypothetical protein SAMN02927937_01746 [Paenimyroides aquimaris]